MTRKRLPAITVYDPRLDPDTNAELKATTKSFKLSALIAETYTSDERKFFGFADRGNGAGFGERGQTTDYDDDAARKYGDVVLTACLPITSEDGRTEYVYAGDWISVGPGNYQCRILF
jgi:hypothetical protein